MAIATRNMYLVLKARDEASRVVRGFGRELTRAGKLAQAEALRSRAAMAMERAAYLSSTGAAWHLVEAQQALAKTYRRQAGELEAAHRQTVRFANAMHVTSSTLMTVGATLAVAGGASLAFLYQSVQVAADYEQQVRRTATQVDNFSASLQEIADVGRRVAQNVAVPFEQIQPALYNILSSTNANLKQAEILLDSFARTAVAGAVSIEDAARGTIPILNAFNIPLENVNDILDIQFQLVRKGVGTYGEFAAVFGRVVPSATRAGQSFDQVAAMLAFLTRNGLTAAMAASSAARSLDALSHPVAVRNMENLGIKVRDAAGHFLPLEQALTNLRNHLEHMPPADRVAALTEIFKGAGGTIQARRFLEQVLLRPGELEEYIGFLHDMQSAQGAFGAAYDTMSESVANQTELMRNKWKVLQESVGRIVTPAFLQIIIWIQKLLDAFNNLDPGTKKFITFGILIGGVLAIISGAIIVLLGMFAGLVAAIMTAGSAFFYIVGGMAAFVAIMAGVTAAVVTAWNKSEGFRTALIGLRDTAKRLWTEVLVPMAMEIKKAWDENMAPALQRFAQVMEEKVFPTVQKVSDVISEKLIPAAKEVGNFFKDIVVTAFEALGKVIDEFVIPAFEKVQTFYYDNKEAIDQLVGVVIFLGKWLLKIALVVGTVLAVAFGGPIVGIILAFVAVIAAVIAIFVLLAKGIGKAVEWIKTNVPKAWSFLYENTMRIWSQIANFFSGIWEAIVTFVKAGWQRIVDSFNLVMAFLSELWKSFWESSIGQLIKAVWDFIVAVVELGWTILQAIWFVASNAIMTAWNFLWNSIKTVVTTVWNFIFPYLKQGWETLKMIATTIWNAIVAVFAVVWGAIKGAIMTVWGFIGPWLTDKWNSIKEAARIIWDAMTGVIKARLDQALEAVKSIWDRIKNFFSGAGGMLYDAGRAIIQGLIDGITSKFRQATDKIRELTDKIRGFFPSSPAKWGPLSGGGSMIRAGQVLVRQLQEGIDREKALINPTIGSLAAGVRDSTMASAGLTSTRNVNNSFVINTPDLNPVKMSEEIGFLIAGRG